MPPKKEAPPPEPEEPLVLEPDDFAAAVCAGFESGEVEKVKEELKRLYNVPTEERCDMTPCAELLRTCRVRVKSVLQA